LPKIHRKLSMTRELRLERIVTLKEAHKLSGLSPDAWKDNYPEYVIRLSPRRLGIKLKHVLNVGRTLNAEPEVPAA
jgi:hypothetical protein